MVQISTIDDRASRTSPLELAYLGAPPSEQENAERETAFVRKMVVLGGGLLALFVGVEIALSLRESPALARRSRRRRRRLQTVP